MLMNLSRELVEDNLQDLTQRIKQLEKDNAHLKERAEDAENRSRASNLRFISVPEKSEDVLGGVIGLVHLYINFPYTSAEERNYNMRHSQARAVVERTIGLFKAPDADGHADPEPNPYPQAFEPIAAAVRQRVAVMRRL
ncbi:hypothetical protein COCON_G00188630 [Conger conger]|uniref:Uncharacterized protein n=1 Tax=Conger conger TaxID=82655 RepID=A0A9Q1HQ56_CONCO|nr:hypothetical protein COCON_G00188630 [Conger conger]